MLAADLHACTYNAIVNHGTDRGVRKMADLTRSMNRYLRAEGREKLERLVHVGIIGTFTPCSEECEVRPGGLHHRIACENDMNHATYKERVRKCRELLPLGPAGDGSGHAAEVTLVG